MEDDFSSVAMTVPIVDREELAGNSHAVTSRSVMVGAKHSPIGKSDSQRSDSYFRRAQLLNTRASMATQLPLVFISQYFE